MISLSVRSPKRSGSGVPRPTDLTETSRDVSHRIGPIPCRWQEKLPGGGVLGFRTPTLSVPSTFYAGEDFPPATASVELSKSGPSRDAPIVSDASLLVNTNWGAFIPPVNGVGFR